MSNTIRCFIALDIPDNIIEEIRKIQEQLKKENLFSGKYTDLNNVHLTLKFLGEINERFFLEIHT